MFKSELEVIDKKDIEAILNHCMTCRIGMVSMGQAYILPMVYGYDWSGDELKLYFHCGLKGRKNEALHSNSCVTFELDKEGELMGVGRPAHLHSRAFECIMGEGTVTFAKNEEEKKRGFLYIMGHQTKKSMWEIPSAYLATTEVFCLHVTYLRASRKQMQPMITSSWKDSIDTMQIQADFDESHGC